MRRCSIDRGPDDFLWFLGGVGLLVIEPIARAPPPDAGGGLALAGCCALFDPRERRSQPAAVFPAGEARARAGLRSAAWLGLVARPPVLNVAVALVLVAGLWRVGVDERTVLGLRWGGLPQVVENLRLDVDRYLRRIDRDDVPVALPRSAEVRRAGERRPLSTSSRVDRF